VQPATTTAIPQSIHTAVCLIFTVSSLLDPSNYLILFFGIDFTTRGPPRELIARAGLISRIQKK
jgi:hypothetical protein